MAVGVVVTMKMHGIHFEPYYPCPYCDGQDNDDGVWRGFHEGKVIHITSDGVMVTIQLRDEREWAYPALARTKVGERACGDPTRVHRYFRWKPSQDKPVGKPVGGAHAEDAPSSRVLIRAARLGSNGV